MNKERIKFFFEVIFYLGIIVLEVYLFIKFIKWVF